MKVLWWRWRDEVELGELGEGKLLRAGDDEHLGQVEGPDGREAGVEIGGERRGADAGSKLQVRYRLTLEWL